MTYEQYVEEGLKALAQEANAGQRLSELAAGVERQHGALTRWAADVGIDYFRAAKLRTAGQVNIDASVNLPYSVALEARNVPVEKLPEVIAKAVALTERPQREGEPSKTAMRQAAARYSKRGKTKTNAAVEHYADEALVILGMAHEYVNKSLVIFRDGETTEDRVRAGCNLLDEIESDAAEIRSLLIGSLDEGLAGLLQGGDA